MSGTSIIPTLHLIKGAYAKVNKLAESAQNFKDKVETAGKQLQEAPERLKTMVSNKVDEVGDSVVDKLKTTASKKLGGLVEEAKGQGAMLDVEPTERLGSMLENSRLGNVYKRFKSATTTPEQKAQSLQEAQFEEDPEAGMQEMRPVSVQPQSQAKIPQAPPEPKEGPGPVPEEGADQPRKPTDPEDLHGRPAGGHVLRADGGAGEAAPDRRRGGGHRQDHDPGRQDEERVRHRASLRRNKLAERAALRG